MRAVAAMKRITLLAALAAACLALAPFAATAEDSAALGAASLSELLRPSLLKLGVLPNLDGLLDGNFEATLKWSKYLSSGLEADYSGSSDSAKETAGAAVLEAKVFQKDYTGRLRLLEFLVPMSLGGGSGIGLGAGLACGYSGLSQSLSGYKTVQGETVYFNQDKLVHRIMPTLDLSLAAAGRKLSLDVSGAYLPYVLILEEGRKLYSTYPEAIPYSVTNVCSGWRGKLGIATMGSALGDISIGAEATGLFGKYGTIQKVVTGNYKTTIETYDDYSSISGTAYLEYRMGYLRKALGLVPALKLGCSLSYETFGAIPAEPELAWKAGLSLGSR
jgi:hypothetical protein